MESVKKTLMDLSRGSIIREDVPRNEQNGANQSPSNVLWELFQWTLGQAQIGVLFPQEHLILTHEIQNVWDCCASISQNCSCVF